MKNFKHTSINIDDLIRLCIIVSDQDWLIAPQRFSKQELYQPFNYLNDEERETYVLIDRNIASYLAKFYGGIEQFINDENLGIFQNLSAYMAFFQISNIHLEPNIAYYEYANSSSYAQTKEEYIRLQTVNNLPTDYFISTALGREAKFEIDYKYIRNNLNINLFSDSEINKRLRHWTFNNIHIKKALLISQKNDSPSQKFREYINWAWTNCLLSGPSTLFIILFFKNKYIGMVKSKKNTFDSIRNATWDLTLLQVFCTYASEEYKINKRWYLLTNDNALKEIAKDLIVPEEFPISQYELLKGVFEKYWDKKNWKQLYDEYILLKDNEDSKDRKVNNLTKNEITEYYKELNNILDEQIRTKICV